MSVYSASSVGSTTPGFSRRFPVVRVPRVAPSTTSTTSGSLGGMMSDLPLSVVFDDIMRKYDQFNNYGVETEFQEFIISQEVTRKKWLEAEQELIRVKTECQNFRIELQKNERKLIDVRRQYETSEGEVSRLKTMESRLASGKILINSYLADNYVSVDAKDKVANVLAVLEGVEYKRTLPQPVLKHSSPGNALDTISEVDTTDISKSHSDDDILEYAATRRSRGRRNKRGSAEAQFDEITRKKLRSNTVSKQVVENFHGTEQVISQTIVSIPMSGGPVHAVATLKTIPASNAVPTHISHITQPSAPPMTGTSDSDSEPVVQRKYRTRASCIKASTLESIPQSPQTFGRTLSATSGTMKPHSFVTKTIIKPESCETCNSLIRFSKKALKCKGCKTTCHPECRDRVPLPCVASSTPSNRTVRGLLGVIADYTPPTHPMVPALIQHSVNEIEVRGLHLPGLYRIPGQDKDVRELKDRFLRGKGLPNLSRYDVYVICGTVKDFLRTLHEPLVGRWFWRDFALATDISDPIKRQTEIHRTLDELPPPNQDTLAFFILHLQRIAEVEEVKMPLSNFAKIFGPTIIGYSAHELDAATMLKETKKQQLILETLLSMSSEYWETFLKRPNSEQENTARTTRSRASRFSSIGRATVISQTSSPKVTTKQTSVPPIKKIYFTDGSPQAPLPQIRHSTKTYATR